MYRLLHVARHRDNSVAIARLANLALVVLEHDGALQLVREGTERALAEHGVDE